MKRGALALACVLASPVALRAQEKPPEPAAAKACGRVVLERAAFVEEHERDLTKAAALYEEAERLAAGDKDEKTAREAHDARARVLGRLGRAAAPGSTATDPAMDERIYRIVKPLDGKQSEAVLQEIVSRLALYGSAAVPWLERTLRHEVVFSPRDRRLIDQGVLSPEAATDTFIGDPRSAVVALAAIEGPEALAALERGFESSDPEVRLAVVRVLDPVKSRALLVRAFDQTAAIRNAAILRFERVADPELAERFARYARGETDFAAREWLSEHDRPALVALALAADVSSETRADARGQASRRSGAALHPCGLVALSALESAAEAPAAERALALLAGMVWVPVEPDLTGALGRVEAGALRWLDEAACHESAGNVVLRCGGIATVEAVAAGRLGNRPSVRPDMDPFEQALERLVPNDLPRLLAIASKVPSSSFARYCDVIVHLLDPTLPPALLAKALESLPANRRLEFVVRVILKAKADPALLGAYSVARDAVASSDREEAVTKTLEIDDPATLPALFAWLSDAPVRTRAMYAFIDHVRRDLPAGLRFLDQVLPSLIADANAGTDADRLVAALMALPGKERLAYVVRVWPEARSECARYALTSAVLEVSAPQATAFLAEHYAELAANDKARALKRFGSDLFEPAVPLLMTALHDTDPRVRSVAQETVREFKKQKEAIADLEGWQTGDKKARETTDELVKLLESKSWPVVKAALQSLGALKAKSALPAIARLLERPESSFENPGVEGTLAVAVRETIEQIAGK